MTDGDRTGEAGFEAEAPGGDLPTDAERLARFAERFQSLRVTSTAAAIVSYSGALYNVDDSTGDPLIDGLKWKQLLITLSSKSTGCKIVQSCYADTPVATTGSSHNAFSVGGHMTPNSSGVVAKGGSCYLMPLCSWHNSKARDGQAFGHANTCMLMLSGYMQSEPFATFMARMDGAAPAAIVYAGEEGLESRPLEHPGHAAVKALGLAGAGADRLPESFVILHRAEEDGETFYRIADSRTGG